MGHRAKDCHSRETRGCFNCGQKGHLASSCKKGQQRSSSGGCGSGQSSNHSSADFFSFDMGNFDSGCNCLMIKNRQLFSDLDEGFLADVCNAYSSRSEIKGRGTVQCFVRTIRAVLVYWVPSYARNLAPVKRLTDKRAVIQFNDNPTIKMPNRTVVPMMTNDGLLSVMAQPVETCSLTMMSHSIKHWRRVMGYNKWHDVAKLQHEVVGIKTLAPKRTKRRRTATSAVPKRRSLHAFRRRRALERKRNWLSFTQTYTDTFNRIPRGFSLCTGLHRQLQLI